MNGLAKFVGTVTILGLSTVGAMTIWGKVSDWRECYKKQNNSPVTSN